jgi:hypothetical protein
VENGSGEGTWSQVFDELNRRSKQVAKALITGATLACYSALHLGMVELFRWNLSVSFPKALVFVQATFTVAFCVVAVFLALELVEVFVPARFYPRPETAPTSEQVGES